MTRPHDTDPRASGRAALERLWLLGQRLAASWRDLQGTMPTTAEDLAAFAEEAARDPLDAYLFYLGQMRSDAFLFRLSAVLSALTEDAMEEVLLAEDELFLIYDTSDNMRDLERCGAIPSADEVLAIRERAWRHHRIATLTGAERADALNMAWADGRAMLDMLVWLSRHLQEKNLFPGLRPFDEDPA